MFSKDFVQAVQLTWSMIGSDVLQCYVQTGEEPDNEACVEGCLDADHIVTYGGEKGKAAQDEFRAKIAEIGYGPALKLAVKSLPYPFV